MVCTPGFIWGQKGAAEYKRRDTGEGDTFWERKRTRVSYVEYRGGITASSLCHHIKRYHRIARTKTRGVDVKEGALETYVLSFPQILKSV